METMGNEQMQRQRVKTSKGETKRDFLIYSASAAAVGNEEGYTNEAKDQTVGAANLISFLLKPSLQTDRHNLPYENVIMKTVCVGSCLSGITHSLTSSTLWLLKQTSDKDVSKLKWLFRVDSDIWVYKVSLNSSLDFTAQRHLTVNNLRFYIKKKDQF